MMPAEPYPGDSRRPQLVPAAGHLTERKAESRVVRPVEKSEANLL